MSLTIEGLASGYGRTRALWDVHLHLESGHIGSLLGLNGAGKTTLLRTIMGLLPIQEGDIRFMGNSLKDLEAHSIARKGITYVPQDTALFPDLTVEENLKVAFRTKTDFDAALKRAVEPFPVLAKRLKQHAGTLSGGEQKMLLLARALLVPSRLILIDEVTEGVQPTALERFRTILKALNEKDHTTILLVEQNIGFALDFADEYWVMKQGKIVLQGRVEDQDSRKIIEETLAI